MARLRPRLVALLILLALLAGGAWLLWRPARVPAVREAAGELSAAQTRQLAERLTALEEEERRLDETVWAPERLAEQCGAVFEQLWDAINAATNQWAPLRDFAFGELRVADWTDAEPLPHGIERRLPGPGRRTWSAAEWQGCLTDLERAGWQLAQVELRHTRFDVDAAGRPQRSVFSASAHLVNDSMSERAVLVGHLTVDWAMPPGAASPTDPRAADRARPAVARLEATDFTLLRRRGEPPFQLVAEAEIVPPEKSFFIDPLILYDLDGDGHSEIILAARNLVLKFRPGAPPREQPMCRQWPGLVFTGVIADFDGDAAADFLYATFEGLFLAKGSPPAATAAGDGGVSPPEATDATPSSLAAEPPGAAAFEQPPRRVWSAAPHLRYGQVLTCGDIDGDGDLDVWLGQYKVPYERGQMPTPYDDANDGHPAYLLLNDGHGQFTDATAAAGLDKKRWRRTYSGSLVDLDDDGDLDLVVVSDFAGVDLYANDGRGRFTDLTQRWVDESHATGMAHAVADFNRDGLSDVLMIGMNSPVVDRLTHLGLVRPGTKDDARRRAALMFGNRLYLRRAEGGFAQSPLGRSLARSGWSWGCSAFDADNDGWLDVYIANGHETQASVRDYETEFWLHDAYVATSSGDIALTAYFGSKHARTRGRGWSYGGWEKNRLYLNQGGASFLEVGHLFGVALEADSRNVATDDLDGDGRRDLLVTTFEAWPTPRQRLLVFQNTLPTAGNWIGFRLREHGPGRSPIGAKVTVRAAGTTWVRPLLTGDSYRTQHAPTVHFGLGRLARVDEAEVRWPDGQTTRLLTPALNRYHSVPPPSARQTAR